MTWIFVLFDEYKLEFFLMHELAHGNQAPRLVPDRFSIIFVFLKSPFYSYTGAKNEGGKRRTGAERTKRERTNKFAANRPLKTRHANGPRGNFKFSCCYFYPAEVTPAVFPSPFLSTNRIHPSR